MYLVYGFASSHLHINSSSSGNRTRWWWPQHNWPKFEQLCVVFDIEKSRLLSNRPSLTIYQFLVFIRCQRCHCRWIRRFWFHYCCCLLLRLRWYQTLFDTKMPQWKRCASAQHIYSLSHIVLFRLLFYLLCVQSARHSKWPECDDDNVCCMYAMCSSRGGRYPPSQPIKCVAILYVERFVFLFRWLETSEKETKREKTNGRQRRKK